MKSRIVRANAGSTKLAPDDKFVGQVLQDQVFVPEDPSRLRVTRVTFTPGGRTNWHTHAVGQILYVLSGAGRYQLEGEEVNTTISRDRFSMSPSPLHGQSSRPDQML